jgi:putative NADH-flavin reductase
MNALKIKRLICITGAMIGKNAAPHLSAFMKIMYRNFNRKYPDIARDRSQQEELIMNSSLDWTIIKPGRLSNGKRKVSYKTGEELKISAFSSISRRGLADFILKILEDEKFFRRSIMIKN